MPNAGSFLVPLTFPRQSIAGPTTKTSISNVLEASLLDAEISCIAGWSLDRNEVEQETKTVSGVIVGVKDGSVFIFHQNPSTSDGPVNVEPTLTASHLSRPTSPIHRHAESITSRSGSPSGFHPPFNVTSPSRIVSGVNTEQVEAPKNYVDFDDEPAKLKSMLQGRSNKEPSRADHPEKNPIQHPQPHRTKRKEAPKSLLSATNSPSNTPSSISSPPSPSTKSAFPSSSRSTRLQLGVHVIPPRKGPIHAVRDIVILPDNTLAATLHENGDISLLNTKDGRCVARTHVDAPLTSLSPAPSSSKVSSKVWLWNNLRLHPLPEAVLIVACSTLDTEASRPYIDDQDNADPLSRFVVFTLQIGGPYAAELCKLEKLSDWEFNGHTSSAGIHLNADGSRTFFYVSWDGHFMARTLQRPPPAIALGTPAQADEPLINLPNLPIPNPFKSSKPGNSAENTPLLGPEDPDKVTLDEEIDVGMVQSNAPWVGFCSKSFPHGVPGQSWLKDKLLVLCWSRSELVAVEYWAMGFRTLFVESVVGIESVKWTKEAQYVVIFKDHSRTYQLVSVSSPRPDYQSSRSLKVRPELQRTFDTSFVENVHVLSPNDLLATSIRKNERKHLKRFSAAEPQTVARTIWSPPKLQQNVNETRLTGGLAVDLNMVLLGYSDGHLHQTNFLQLCQDSDAAPPSKGSDIRLDGCLLSFHVVQNSRTKERFIFGGADDGSVAVWTLDTLKLVARWVLFITPLDQVLCLTNIRGPLQGCALCISQNGTIAVIAVDGLQFLYLIPGAPSRLRRVCIGEDNLLLSYENGTVRLWDVRTKEFWRSMSQDKAQELLQQGGWTELSVDGGQISSNSVLKQARGFSSALDEVSTCLLDLEMFVTEATSVIKSISNSKAQTEAIFDCRDQLSAFLSVLLTPGLNTAIDEICQEHFRVSSSAACLGLYSGGFTSLYPTKQPSDPWCISGEASAVRILSVVAILRVLSLFDELSDAANTLIAFYTTSIQSAVGSRFENLSLPWLASRWFDSSNELKQAARIIFDATVARLSDQETIGLAEEWQHHLPWLQPAAEKESLRSALSLFLCGYIAAEKYSLLSASALMDISKSISLYLHDENSIYRVLAIDLCSRGFHVWQHYIDVMEILRALFNLATSSKKEAITAQNISAQARLAVLQIATNSTPLFMTTLGMDILSPATLEHRKAVMQIVAFLIRKRPLVLYPNLPKLMEAVVKSLDPNSTSNRDAVLDTATEILGHVVKTFPSVDFQMSTQRLAVGTTEGAIVMYDLKTAIRLYVLEGHKQRVTACSFSPDGRRLVTLSLEESVVLVWKVGSSFSSFFNPGAPPRQGHSGSDSFKTLSFNVGDEARMSLAESLQLVKFEWVADRSVKLKIRESTLTFST